MSLKEDVHLDFIAFAPLGNYAFFPVKCKYLESFEFDQHTLFPTQCVQCTLYVNIYAYCYIDLKGKGMRIKFHRFLIFKYYIIS